MRSCMNNMACCQQFECYKTCMTDYPPIDYCPIEESQDSSPKDRQSSNTKQKHYYKERKKNLRTLSILCNTIGQVSVLEAHSAVKKAMHYLRVCKRYKNLPEHEAKKLHQAERNLKNSQAYKIVYRKGKVSIQSLVSLCSTIDDFPILEAIKNVQLALNLLEICENLDNLHTRDRKLLHQAKKVLKNSQTYKLIYCHTLH